MNGSLQHICILVPARNEEKLIGRCLRSIERARTVLPHTVTSDLVVAVDSSTDQTWEIARAEVTGLGRIVRTQAGAVGGARAVAAEAALKRYKGPLSGCWLANTDADSIVPESWLCDQLLLAANCFDAIAGTVDVDNYEDHLPVVKERFRATYLIDPDGRHPHVHGANLGVRADYYRRAGGWADLSTGEDHDLWRRLSAVGARRLSASQIQVVTSGRKVGRAPHGFADALAAHNSTVA